MLWKYNDGGRALAGYKGETGDCVARAIAIGAELSYSEVYDALNKIAQSERIGKRKRGISSARLGVYKATERKYLLSLGWSYTATMGIGTGCRIHLRANELPGGRLIVQVSRHLVAVVDGVMHDTSDPSREGTRCVYGYWAKGGDTMTLDR
jgi:hypothetical protein